MEMIKIDRRRALFAGLGGGALALVGGGLGWLRLGYALRPGEAAIALSVKELCVARAIVNTLLPAADGLPSGVSLGVHQRIDEEVWAQPGPMRRDLRAALQLIEHAPPLLGGRGRFTSLDPEARERVFRRLLASDVDAVAQSASAFKQLAHLFYYGHPQAWAHLGYDGPWVKSPRPAPSSDRYAALLARRERERARA
jgi:hypothetical protein